MKNIFSGLIILFMVPYLVLGQKERVTINGDFKQVQIIRFIEQVEQKTDVHFFFKEAEIQDIIVNANFNNASIEECLSEILEGGLVKHYVNKNQVFLYQGKNLSNLFQEQVKVAETIVEQNEQQLSREKLRRKQYELNNIGIPGANKTGYAVISGVVATFETGEPIIGCNVYTREDQRGTSTDKNGYFNIKIPLGNHILVFSSVGMMRTERQIQLYSDGKLNVEMETKINLLSDVDIKGDRLGALNEIHGGVERIDIKLIKTIPALLGEADIMKTVLILPGVSTVGEGTSGFNVRGGKTDQNLILIDDSPIYYPSHFFGNFSAINSDMVNGATLYKGNMPAKYGGRISSVYQINTKDGDSKKITGSAGVSNVSARIMVEGPIQKDKSSFLASFRTTYSDWVLNQIKTEEFYNSSVDFLDTQVKLNLKLNKRNRLIFNAYGSNDGFQLKNDTTYKYENRIASVILKTNNNGKWEMQNSLSYSFFNYNIAAKTDSLRSFELIHALQDISFKNSVKYKINDRLKLNVGAESHFYLVNPGERKVPPYSEVELFKTNTESALEFGLFGSVEFKPIDRLTVEAGTRFSSFLSLADGDKNIYQPGLSVTEKNLIGTVTTKKNSVEKSYFNPELRLSANYMLSPLTSVKGGYNSTTQYLHMLTNTTAISPTDIWKLSDLYLTPQKGQQVSLGFVKTNYQNTFELSLEGFYKRVKDIKEYKAGADLLLTNHMETEIINGKGKSYGAELSMQKRGGRLYGRLGYTYSRTLIKTESEFEEELINDGEYFPANYDKPHNLDLLANFNISRRLIFTSTLNYSTGRPITYPVAKYIIGNQTYLHYSDYNQYRIPDYFRIDVSVTIDGNLKFDKLTHGTLTFSIYNVTARRNAYSIYFRNTANSFEGYKLSIFGEMIPTLTYNLKF